MAKMKITMSTTLLMLIFTLMITFALLFGALAILYRYYRSHKKYISEIEVKSVPSLFFYNTLTPKVSNRLKIKLCDSREESFYWMKTEDEPEFDQDSIFATLNFQPKRTSTHGNIYELCI